jgi:hypothetical protein
VALYFDPVCIPLHYSEAAFVVCLIFLRYLAVRGFAYWCSVLLVFLQALIALPFSLVADDGACMIFREAGV